MPRAIASAAVRWVSTKSGMTAGHACEPGVHPFDADEGAQRPVEQPHQRRPRDRERRPAIRASAQVWRDAPCHSSAMK